MDGLYDRIKNLRKLKGISQADMGDRLGMSQNNFGKIERGEIDLTINRLKQIAKALNVSLKEVLFPESLQDKAIPELTRELEIIKREKEVLQREKDVQAKENTLALYARDETIQQLMDFLKELSRETVVSSRISEFLKDFEDGKRKL